MTHRNKPEKAPSPRASKLAALTARVTTLESTVATLQAAVNQAQADMQAAQEALALIKARQPASFLR